MSGTAKILDFSSGASPTWNGWLGFHIPSFGAGSSLTSVAAPKAGSGRSTVARIVMDTAIGSDGAWRVLVSGPSDIHMGDTHFFTFAGLYPGANVNDDLIWEVHDPYSPGTDDARIGNCVAPIALCTQQSYLIDPADWAASPMHATTQQMTPGFYTVMFRRCFGNGTKNGAGPSTGANYDRIVNVPLAPFVQNTWMKLIMRIDWWEDQTDPSLVTGANPMGYKGGTKVWTDFSSDTAGASFQAEGSPVYTSYGATMKYTTGSLDGQIQQFRNSVYYPTLGLYRTQAPGSAQTIYIAGADRFLTYADAVADFGGAPATSPPTLSVSPSVSGTTTQGQTLTGTDGSVTGSPTPTVSLRKFYRCDTNGANLSLVASGSSYDLTATDVGHTMRYGVTWTNSGGTYEFLSAPTAVVSLLGTARPVVESSDVQHTNGATTVSGTLDISANSKIVYIFLGDAYPAPLGTTVTLGGQALTNYVAGLDNDNGMSVAAWYIRNPPVGLAIPYVVTWPSTRTATVIAASVINTDTATLGTVSSTAHYGNNPSLTVPTTNIDLALLFTCSKVPASAPGTSPPTPGAGATLVATGEANSIGYYVRASLLAKNGSTTSTTIDSTISPNPLFGYAALAFGLAAATPNAAAPVNDTIPTLLGDTIVGSTVTRVVGTYENVDGASVYTYQWQRDTAGNLIFESISGQVGTTYTYVTADLGCNVRVVEKVQTTGGFASSPSAPSGLITAAVVVTPVATLRGEPAKSLVGKVDNLELDLFRRSEIAPWFFKSSVVIAPSINTPPAISDTTPTLGDTVTCDLGSWANTPTDYLIQWKLAGVDIPLAVGRSLFVDATMIGGALTVTVAASNSAGSASSTSSATTAVAGLVPAIVVKPRISALALTLTAVPGDWLYTPTSRSYQWKADATNVGIDSLTYVAAADDTRTFTVTETATNATGPGTPSVSAGVVLSVIATAGPPSALDSGDTAYAKMIACGYKPSVANQLRLALAARNG